MSDGVWSLLALSVEVPPLWGGVIGTPEPEAKSCRQPAPAEETLKHGSANAYRPSLSTSSPRRLE